MISLVSSTSILCSGSGMAQQKVLPIGRGRARSTPSSNTAPAKCHFFRLPVELRLTIYELALERPSIHIWTRHTSTQTSRTWPHKVQTWNTRHLPSSDLRTMHLRTGHAVCSKPTLFQSQYDLSRHEEEPCCPSSTITNDFCVQACSGTKFFDLTGIIFTCRKAYSESHLLPYELFTFVFVNGFHAEFFLRKALTPAQASRIRNLHFERWNCQPDAKVLNQWADLALYRQISPSTVDLLHGLRRISYRDLEFRVDVKHGIWEFRRLKLANVKAVFEIVAQDEVAFDREAASRFENALSGRQEDFDWELASPEEHLWCCEARCRDLWEPYDWKDSRGVVEDT